MTKKICIVFNHFQFQDGVARAAIAAANTLSQIDGVEVTLIPLFRFNEDAFSLIDERVKVKPLFKRYFRGMQRLVDLLPKKWLYSRAVKEKYDIEIGFCIRTPIQIIANSKNKDAKRFVWMHGYDNGLTLLNEYLKADKLICVSRENAERVRKETNGKVDADFAYNLTNDLKIVELGEQEIDAVKPEETTFVTVGRLSEEKGFARLITTVKRLKSEGYKLKLWIVGSGPEGERLTRQVKELELEDDVIFWGTQKNPHPYTAKADVFVCSSYTEGYSTVCTEAVMLGIPVVSTRVGGAKEIIEDSEVGLLVENSDEALYEGMKKVLDDPSLIKEWKERLQETKSKFSHAERSKKLIRLLGLDEEK